MTEKASYFNERESTVTLSYAYRQVGEAKGLAGRHWFSAGERWHPPQIFRGVYPERASDPSLRSE